jgi:hypothetical protein
MEFHSGKSPETNYVLTVRKKFKIFSVAVFYWRFFCGTQFLPIFKPFFIGLYIPMPVVKNQGGYSETF